MNKQARTILVISLFSILVFVGVKRGCTPSYWTASIVKIGLFFLLPFSLMVFQRNLGDMRNFFVLKGQRLYYLISIGVSLGILAVIVGGYYIFSDLIDLVKIQGMLQQTEEISAKNFLLVAAYITFVNSFLEEFFFRGFLFLQLKKAAPEKLAYILSAGLFALYHLALIGNWFHPLIMALVLAGLFIGGMIFNYMDAKTDNILQSWLIHIFADIAVMIVGSFMFF